MGTYKSKGIKVDAEKLPELEEELDYEVKTRPPLPDAWKLNLLRGIREDELKDKVMPIARRKCIRKVKNNYNKRKYIYYYLLKIFLY